MVIPTDFKEALWHTLFLSLRRLLLLSLSAERIEAPRRGPGLCAQRHILWSVAEKPLQSP